MARSVTPLLTEGSQHKTDAGVRDKYKRLINLFVFTGHFFHLAALQLTVPKRQKKAIFPVWYGGNAKVQRPLSLLSLATLQVL